MKKISASLVFALTLSSFGAVASPVQMTESEMEKVVAGATYDVYLNKGGNYAIKLQGDPNPTNRGAMSFITTLECSADGTGSCSYLSKDFAWDEVKLRWH